MLWVKNALDDAAAVSQVNEHDATVIPHSVDPATQRYRLPDMARSQFAAMMGFEHCHVPP